MKPRVVLLDAGDPRVSFDSGSVLRPAIGGNVLAAASEMNCSLHERPASGAAQCHSHRMNRSQPIVLTCARPHDSTELTLKRDNKTPLTRNGREREESLVGI
jgi:hypothetical protein